MPEPLQPTYSPSTPEELAEMLRTVMDKSHPLEVFGRRSKHEWGGPMAYAPASLSTAALDKVLRYEHNDLTVSVEAGICFTDLQRLLASQSQMVALDPPLYDTASVGGMLAANSSGPMRRHYGTARDQVIGMTFATLEGKLIRSGGMVVKNVAGLDMAKLMIGSFGTLAVLATVNFRLHPIPEQTLTFVLEKRDSADIIAKRDAILQSSLRPIAIDLVNKPAAKDLGFQHCVLLVRAAGSPAVLARYRQELSGMAVLSSRADEQTWEHVREFAPRFLAEHQEGTVLLAHCASSEVETLFQLTSEPILCRCGSGLSYLFLSSPEETQAVARATREHGWTTKVEAATKSAWLSLPAPKQPQGLTQSLKQLFDPYGLLNPGRLYGRI